MDSFTSSQERVVFLMRVTERVCLNLLSTDYRLFRDFSILEDLQKIELDPILAERLDAFVSRFGRLHDTVGDKLLPALLISMAEKPGAAIDNLDRAEKLGFIESSDTWMEMRRLRNQMVHEYIQDIEQLTNALMRGKELVPMLIQTQQKLCDFYSTTQTDKTI